MAQAVLSSAWDRTSTMWALVAECNRDPKKRGRAFEPFDVHPFRKRQRQYGSIEILKQFVTDAN